MDVKTTVDQYIKAYSYDETQSRAMKHSLVFTGIVWLVLFVFFAVSPGLHKKPKYKTVRITLEPAVERMAEKSVASSAAQESPKAEPVQTPQSKPPSAEQKTASAKQPVASQQPASQKAATAQQPKTEPSAAKPAATQPKPATSAQTKPAVPEKKANIKYAQSVDDLMAQQTTQKLQNNVDWDSIDFEENTSSSPAQSSPSKTPAPNANALSGTAAETTGASGTVKATSDSASRGSSAVSGNTAKQLGNISSARPFAMSVGNGLSSSSTVKASNTGDGKLALDLTDGSSRVLLDPSKPYIEISDESAALIDSTRNVVITFRILAAGNVPLSGVSISPSAALPAAVQSEIRAQISKWRFVPASTDGQARFDYSIIKR